MPCAPSPGGYAAPAEVYTSVAGLNGGSAFTAVSMESYIQKMIASETSNPSTFLLNPPLFYGLAATGPSGVAQALLDTINQRCASYPSMCATLDKNALAAKYAQVLFSALQAIPACGFDQSLVGSVYDNWGKGITPQACPPGYSGTHDTGCIPPPCPAGFARFPYADSPCAALPTAAVQVTPGKSNQTAPSGSVPTQTTPSTYGGGTTIQTNTGGGGTGGSSQVAPNAGSNGQTPFVAANIIPASTLATNMQNLTGQPLAVPGQWCQLMGTMLGGFACPANLSVDSIAPIDATTFLAALRATESAQNAAPAITAGGFNIGGAPAPDSTVNSGNPPAKSGGFTMTPMMIGVAVALVVVILLIKK